MPPLTDPMNSDPSIMSSPEDINLHQSSSTSNFCIPNILGIIMIVLAVGVLVVLIFLVWKCTGVKKKYTRLQNESQMKETTEKAVKEVVTALKKHKRDLEGQLEDVETKKEENKRRLQLVETEITEREKKFDKPEKLLKDKEDLLTAQWKLDETKKNCEVQTLKIESWLELIEIY